MDPALYENLYNETLFERLRRDCEWRNPESHRDKLVMDERLPDAKGWQAIHPGVRDLAKELSKLLDADFDKYVVQRYRAPWNGGDWHTDNFGDLDNRQPMAIVSFGTARIFEVRSAVFGEDDEAISTGPAKPYLLTSGSLFVMPPGFQLTHEHRLAPMDEPIVERISLIFSRRK